MYMYNVHVYSITCSPDVCVDTHIHVYSAEHNMLMQPDTLHVHVHVHHVYVMYTTYMIFIVAFVIP